MKTNYLTRGLAILIAAVMGQQCAMADPPATTQPPVTAATGTAAYAMTSGTAGALNGLTWNQNLNGQAFVFEGDSITANPNGAGQVSYAGIIASGTYPYATFFNGHGTSYVDAVGGAVIGSGTTGAANGPQFFTASWSGTTATLVLSGSAVQTPGYMSVTGTNIAFPTSGVITSGSILTLSQPTLGPSGGTVTVRLGGNNIMDRMGEAYPHRPAANGGDGGPRAYLFMADGGGANCLAVGESGTSIIQDMLAVTATAEAFGFIPVISPTLPTGYRGGGPTWWSPAQEAQRQVVNTYVRRHEVPGAMVVDMCEALSGENLPGPADTNWQLYDVNGIHPIGYANAMLANYLNSAMLDMGQAYPATPEAVDHAVAFNDPITINQGVTISGSLNAELSILQPGLMLGGTEALTLGVAEDQQRAFRIAYGYNAATGGGNTAAMGFLNAQPLYLGGAGQIAIGNGASPAIFSGNSSSIIASAINADAGLYVQNTDAGGHIVAVIEQPNASVTYGLGIGTGESTNNMMTLGFKSIGNGNAANYLQLYPFGATAPVMTVDMSGNTYIAGGTTAGYVDPVAAVPLYARFVTHRPGSNAVVGAYKDRGCTSPAANAGDAFLGFRDDLATGAMVLSSSASTCTLQYVDGYPVARLTGSTNDAFQMQLTGTYNLANADIWIRYRVRNSSQGNNGYLLDGVSGGGWANNNNSFTMTVQDFFTNLSPSVGNANKGAQSVMVTEHLVCRSGTYCALYANGTLVFTSGTAPSGGITNLTLGAQVYPTPGTILNPTPLDIEALILGNNVTAAQAAAIDASLTPNLRTGKSPIVCTGDSLTQGFLSSLNVSPPDDYPDQLQVLAGSQVDVINDGHWGWGLVNGSDSGLLGSVATMTDSMLQQSGTMVLEIGTNDIANGSAASAVESALASYINGRTAAGATVYVCTILPRASSGMAVSTGTFESIRETVNAWIRSNCSNVIDEGADSYIGWNGSGTNPASQTVYYNTDDTHLNAAGFKIFAANVWRALNKPVMTNIITASVVNVTGTLSLSGTAAAPANTGTAAYWVAGTLQSGTMTMTGRFPFYQ